MGVSHRTRDLRHSSWIRRLLFPGRRGLAAAAEPADLPAFLVIGPPRTGTTWLHEVLSKHALLPSPSKETRFFDNHFQRGFDWYRAHFPANPEKRLVGEIAPTYFASSEARERIAASLPGVRAVCIFRNPVHRVISLYRIKRAYGMIPWSFEEALLHDPELVASGRYASHLKAWRQSLSPERILATLYDDLRDHSQGFVDTVGEFIGLPRFTLTPSQVRRVHGSESMTEPRNYYRTRTANAMAEWFKAKRLDSFVATLKDSPLRKLVLGGGPPFSEIPTPVSKMLYELFLPEIEELETLLDRDLSSWKSLHAAPSVLAAS